MRVRFGPDSRTPIRRLADRAGAGAGTTPPESAGRIFYLEFISFRFPRAIIKRNPMRARARDADRREDGAAFPR